MTLLELPENLSLFKRLFTVAYSIPEPILPLRRIMHWQAVRESLPVSTPDLDHSETLVFGGYFFNFSTPQLTDLEIRSALEFGRTRNVGQFLIPTVREDIDESALKSHGFLKIPWFVESIFDIEGDIDSLLRVRIGSKRFRTLKSVVSASNERYTFVWMDLEALKKESGLINKIVELHQQNIKKYNHTVNLYPAEVIHSLLQSSINNNIVVLARYEKSSGALVQVAICMKDTLRKDLFVLVQGRDYEYNPPGQNLYNSLFYECYRYAFEQGLKTIYLGRGNHNLKRHLGANRFRTLNNWILAENTQAKAQLQQVAALVSASLQFTESESAYENK